MRLLMTLFFMAASLFAQAQFLGDIYEIARDNGDRFLAYKVQFHNFQTGEFNDHDSASFYYDAAGLPDTIVRTPIGPPIPDEVSVYHHDNGKRQWIKEFERTNGKMELTDSTAFSYHVSGALSAQRQYRYDAASDTFQPLFFYTYERLPDGRDTLFTEQFFNTVIVDTFIRKTHKSYNANGRLTERLTLRDTGTGLYPFDRATVIYPNPNDSIVTFAQYDQAQQQWDTLNQYRHYLDGTGLTDSLEIYYYDTTAGKLVGDTKITYEYAGGRPAMERHYRWNLNEQRWEYLYHVRSEYNAEGKLTLRTGEIVDSINSHTIYRNEQSYNDHGDKDTLIHYQQYSGTLQPMYRLIYYWQQPSGIANPRALPAAAKVYPVPASSAMLFELPRDYAHLTLRVYDMTGKRISEISGAGHQIKWHIPHGLEAGSYVYQVQTEEELFSGKVVVGE